MRSQPCRPCSSPEGPALAAASAPGQGRSNDHGVALVITLLLLFLLSVIGLAAVLSSSSDLMINGYYKNYRGSFYAADAGLNIARQDIYNYFQNNAPASWPTDQNTANASGSALGISATSNITSTYGTSYYSLNGHGQAGSSVPASFQITSASVTSATVTPTGTSGNYTKWTYVYSYSLTAVGSSQGSATATIKENGTITVNVTQGSGTTTNTVSFSAFGAFIDSFTACQGPLVQGYLTGPMYADGEWNLGYGSPGYTFTDVVSQTDSKFSYYDSSGHCAQSASVPYGNVRPSFQSGYALGVTPITLPVNDFSQKWAVLDGKGCGEGSNVCGNTSSPAPPQPTAQDMVNHNMQNVSQQPYATGSPLTAATSGVYLPYTCSGGTCSLNPNAGGIYVEGSGSGVTTSVTMSTTNGAGGSSNPSGQVFTIAQTTSSTTGSPVVSQTGSTTCTYSSSKNKTTCTANFQKATTTTTPTAFTTVTVDPVAVATTASAYIQNGIATVTATASSSCSVSGTGSCSPSQPSNFSGGTEVDTTSNSATTTLALTGVPHNLVPTSPQAATMLYVNGDITSLSGPSSGAAIQDNSMITVTANGDITQTGNILYATKPVTTSANQSVPGSNPPCCSVADTLIPQYQNMNQVLGIFTATGNFILSPTHSGADIETDASVAMISSPGETNTNIGHMATGNSVGKWTNIGGRIENRAHSVNMNSSNIYFDRRFGARSNFAPPWFPSTSVSQNILASTLTASSQPSPPSRTSWQYQAGQ
jgi:Tfp pilus assembly protein PilX